MDCRKAIELVEKLADGEASPAEKSEAESHLARCESCRSHWDFLRLLGKAAGEASPSEPPEAYWETLPRKILARLEDSGEGRTGGWWRKLVAFDAMRWEALAATVLVAVAVLVIALRDESFHRGASESGGEVVFETRAPEPSEREDVAGRVAPRAQEALEDVEQKTSPAEPQPPPSEPAAPGAKPAPEPRTVAPPTARDLREDSGRGGARAGQLRRSESVAIPERAPESAEEMAPASGLTGQAFEQRERMSGEADASAEGQAEVDYVALLDNAERGDCEVLRRYLAEHAHASRAVDVRYQLARCSLRLYEEEPTEELRARAVSDAEAFLAVENESTRARSIRDALGSIRE